MSAPSHLVVAEHSASVDEALRLHGHLCQRADALLQLRHRKLEGGGRRFVVRPRVRGRGSEMGGTKRNARVKRHKHPGRDVPLSPNGAARRRRGGRTVRGTSRENSTFPGPIVLILMRIGPSAILTAEGGGHQGSPKALSGKLWRGMDVVRE